MSTQTKPKGLSLVERLRKAQEEKLKHDAVDHPPHYTAHPSGVECIDIVEHMNFALGSATKYIWRAGLKGDAVQDLKKARWLIDREIKRLEKAGAK